jgi:hypothetical protein
MKKKIYDPKFNINEVSFKIARKLGSIELPKEDYYRIFIDTFPFYNCRERGIGISVNNSEISKILVIVFGEHRNSDNIFIDRWIQRSNN